MSDRQENTCQILSDSETVGEFRKDFVCLDDSLHESLQNHPHVLILYVAMVIFVMVFLKMVTRQSPSPKSDGQGLENCRQGTGKRHFIVDCRCLSLKVVLSTNLWLHLPQVLPFCGRTK